MAKKYKKDIKVVLPHIDPFRDIAVYGAGEEMIKALGGQLADKGKQPDIKIEKKEIPEKTTNIKKHLVQKITPKERKPNLESIPTRSMDLSSMNVSEDYSMLTPKSNKKESKLSRLSPYTSSTSQYKGEIVDSEGRKELTKQEYEEAVKKYGEGYFKAYGGPINNTNNMKKVNKKGQNPRSILSPEQKMAMQFGWGGALGSALGAAAGTFLVPGLGTGLGASIGGALGSAIDGGVDQNKQEKMMKQYQQPQYMPQAQLPAQMQFAKGGMLNKRGIPNRGTSEQMPYQTQMQSYPNLEFGNGEQMLAGGGMIKRADGSYSQRGLWDNIRDNKGSGKKPTKEMLAQEAKIKAEYANGGKLPKEILRARAEAHMSPEEANNYVAQYANGGQLEDVEFAKGGIYIKPSKRGTFTAAAKKHGKSVQAFASQVLANKENYSPAMVKKANFARNAAKWKHAEGGFLNEPTEGVIERRNKNRSREPQEYATFEENFKHMYAQGGRMGAMGPMDVGNIYYADGGMLNHYTGERHENGGIPMGPNAEVEGGETSMKMGMGGEQDSTYIFSDRLQVPGKKHTFAEASKKIDNKYNRRTNDKLSDESKRLELNKLMESQEQERAGLVNSAYETIAAYGGPIRKYAVGGVDPIGKNSYYSGTDPIMNELMRFSAPTSDDNRAMMGYERAKSYLDFGAASKKAYKKADQEDLAFQNEIASQLDQETPSSPYISLNPSIKQRIAANKESRLNKKMKFNPNAYLENNIPNKSRDFSPAEIDQMMQEAPAKTTPAQYNIPVRGITSQGSSVIPDMGGARSTVNPDNSITSDSFGTGEQWAKGIGYGLQGAGLLARQLQLSSKKNKLSPNKAFTMERQILNAKPQLDEADVSAAIANRNIRDLGASTSSGGAMAGYLAAQAGRTRSKADILSDLQNRQAQIDMTTGQYNTQAQERAYDKDAADLAAQQTSQAQLFADMSKLGAGVTRDYLLGQSQEGLVGSMKTPEYGYKKRKGRNRYDRYYLNEDIG